MTENEWKIGVKNEWAEARRDGRPCLSRRKSQAQTGPGKNKHIFSFQLTTSRRIYNHVRLMHNLLNMVSHYTSTCPRRPISSG